MRSHKSWIAILTLSPIAIAVTLFPPPFPRVEGPTVPHGEGVKTT